MVPSLVARMFSTYLTMEISLPIYFLSTAYLALHSSHYQVFLIFPSVAEFNSATDSVKILSQRDKAPYFYKSYPSASALAEATVFLVVSISPKRETKSAQAYSSSFLSYSAASSNEVLNSSILPITLSRAYLLNVEAT